MFKKTICNEPLNQMTLNNVTSVGIQGEKYSQSLNTSWSSRLSLSLQYIFFIRYLGKAISTLAKREERSSLLSCLDVGCGNGAFLFTLAQCLRSRNLSMRYVGLDASTFVQKTFISTFPQFEFVLGTSEILPFENNSFTIISSMHNIEHLYEPDHFVAEAFRCLEDNGFLVLAAPNPSSLAAFWDDSNWVGFKTEEHVSLMAPFQYRQMIRNAGFIIVDDGSTLLSGYSKVKRNFFFNSLQRLILLMCGGSLPWSSGEAYVCIAQKPRLAKSPE